MVNESDREARAAKQKSDYHGSSAHMGTQEDAFESDGGRLHMNSSPVHNSTQPVNEHRETIFDKYKFNTRNHMVQYIKVIVVFGILTLLAAT